MFDDCHDDPLKICPECKHVMTTENEEEAFMGCCKHCIREGRASPRKARLWRSVVWGQQARGVVSFDSAGKIDFVDVTMLSERGKDLLRKQLVG